jgi:glutamate-1-semialdehyde 2,1-aminomutase
MVTYGKTWAAAFRSASSAAEGRLMKRFRDDRPADICFARGTFNAHPHVMAAMAEFLQHLETPAMQAIYRDLDATWDRRAASLNARLAGRGLPITIAHLSSVWTVCYTASSRYNWMFQYYLREAGLALSWIGTGRLIFSLNFSEADFAAVADRFLAAAEAMRRDGWWEPGALATDRAIKRRILREMLGHMLIPRRRNRSGVETPLNQAPLLP